jgi:hypothetical protein
MAQGIAVRLVARCSYMRIFSWFCFFLAFSLRARRGPCAVPYLAPPPWEAKYIQASRGGHAHAKKKPHKKIWVAQGKK